jgi:hypothetical protein
MKTSITSLASLVLATCWFTAHGGDPAVGRVIDMLLLAESGPTGRIRLLPTWPMDWDVSFKLRAPGKTVVEAVYRGGKIESLKVTPESPRKDVVMPESSI